MTKPNPLNARLDALVREAGKLEETEFKTDAIYLVALNLLNLNDQLEKKLEAMDLVVAGWVTGLHPAMQEARLTYMEAVERNRIRTHMKEVQ